MGVDLEQAEFANEAFYLAFEAKDYEAMAHLWSMRRDVLCLHPGWTPLIGRDAVLESWRQILSNPQQGQVSFYGASVHQLGDDTVERRGVFRGDCKVGVDPLRPTEK